MVKGCQRRIIHIKETGSRYFEEAYFMLKPGTDSCEDGCGEMIDEAIRIIGESLSGGLGKRKKRSFAFRYLAVFAAGALAGAVIFFLSWLLMFTVCL